MAKTIALATDKGGDGKSTVSIQLAEFLDYVGISTLLIDLDPQGNSSKHFTPMFYDPYAEDAKGKMPGKHPDYNPDDAEQTGWDGVSSVADIFAGNNVWPYPTKFENISVIPAFASKLEPLDKVTKDEVSKKVYSRFEDFINLPEIQAQYGAIILDTRPSKGHLTTSAIRAATDLIIPTKMEQFSIDGIYGMLQLWKSENYRREASNQLKLVCILPNLYEGSTRLHSDLKADLERSKGIAEHLCPYQLKKRIKYAELMVDGGEPCSIRELPENEPARKESEQVCQYFFERIFDKKATLPSKSSLKGVSNE